MNSPQRELPQMKTCPRCGVATDNPSGHHTPGGVQCLQGQIACLQEQVRVVSNSWWKLYHASRSAHSFGLFSENCEKILTEALFHAEAAMPRVGQEP